MPPNFLVQEAWDGTQELKWLSTSPGGSNAGSSWTTLRNTAIYENYYSGEGVKRMMGRGRISKP